MLSLVTLLFIAYLIGSVPFGLLLTKAAGMGDIREMGSGNIGATNVLRTGNKKIALLTLLLDMGKGWLAVWWVSANFRSAYPYEICALTGTVLASAAMLLLAVVCGHVFPVWLRFKGGKGVATGIGAVLGFSPVVGMVAMGMWLGIFLATRISSLSALITFSLLPFVPYVLIHAGWIARTGCTTLNLALLPVSLLIIYRHKDNIRRLIAGTEPKFGKKKERK